MKWIKLTGGVLLNMMLAACASTGGAPAVNNELIVCGWDEVFILDFDQLDAKGQPKKVWSWKAASCKGIPDEFKKLFATTDDCKPFEDGRKILISSSGGAIAYVDRQSGDAVFYGRANNAHSIDLLPNNRVAAASSFGGDKLIIYDLGQSDKELLQAELPGGHGVVWDEKRQTLWALSYTDIRVFKLENWESPAPSLKLIDAIPLPGTAGHDFYPIADTPFLSVTGTDCWLFDRDTKKFSPHPQLANKHNIKCISQHPLSGRIVYVQAEGKHWWAENLHFIKPDGTYNVPDEHFYKARWNIRIK